MNKQELKLGARILENIPDMSSDVMQGWIENPIALKKFLAGLVPEEVYLTTLITHKVAGKKSNPLDFFKSREGLWLSDNFKNFILAAATGDVVETNDTEIGHADLAQLANDAEIMGELPQGHVFENVDDGLNYLSTMIDTQWRGKSGVLLNTDYRANIFYVKGVNDETFAVNVHWYSVDREWHCSANRLVDYRRSAFSRVFSATAT